MEMHLSASMTLNILWWSALCHLQLQV